MEARYKYQDARRERLREQRREKRRVRVPARRASGVVRWGPRPSLGAGKIAGGAHRRTKRLPWGVESSARVLAAGKALPGASGLGAPQDLMEARYKYQDARRERLREQRRAAPSRDRVPGLGGATNAASGSPLPTARPVAEAHAVTPSKPAAGAREALPQSTQRKYSITSDRARRLGAEAASESGSQRSRDFRISRASDQQTPRRGLGK